jgi:hypothetical protein
MATRQRYQQLRNAGKLFGTIKRAVQLRENRNAVAFSENTDSMGVRGRHTHYLTPVPFGSPRPDVIDDAVEAIRSQHPRRRNWIPAAASVGETRCETIDNGRYSSRCTWNHYTYHPFIHCCARSLGSILWFKLLDRPARKLRAPMGYRWDTDDLGIRLVSNRDGADYHPTAHDLIQGPMHCSRMLRENRKQRKAEARKVRHELAAIRKAEKRGLLVCLHDSIRAGNCRAGSESWARQHGIDPARHHGPSGLLAAANGDTHRVALVVQAAMRRYQHEMRQGYSLLSDHGIES